jgi:uncharacterized protein with PIN domain
MYAFCRGCGAVLEFTTREAKLTNISLQKGLQNNGKDYLVHCPVCGRAIWNNEWKKSADLC